MRRQELVFIIGLNAAVSLVISLLVVWFLGPQPAPLTVTPETSAPTITPMAEILSQSQDLGPGAQATSATPGRPVHVVQAGETLFWIAERYGVSPESIMEENNLEDPDILSIGQQLTIPTPQPEPSVEPTAPEPSATPTEAITTPTPESTATTALAEIDLAITDIIARGRREAELLVLTNNGRDLRLQGWTLSNGQGDVYVFPNLTLYSGNSIRIYSTDGRNSAGDLYWGLDSPAWGSGVDLAILKDPEGEVWATKELD